MIKQPVKANVSATVKVPVLNPPAAGCFIFIPRKTCAPALVRSVAYWDMQSLEFFFLHHSIIT